MTAKDFDNIEFNPLAVKDGELIQNKYDYLKRRDVFTEPLTERDDAEEVDPNDNKHTLSDIIKFVILFIDMDSPFWGENDFDERITQCLKWAEIKKTDRAYYHIMNETVWYQEIMAKYFAYVADSEFEEFVSRTMSLRNLNAFLRSGINSDDPEKSTKAHSDLQKTIGGLRESLDKLQAKIFPKNRKLQKKIVQYTESKDNFQGHAEKRAKYLEN